jgi:hypothetical protein
LELNVSDEVNEDLEVLKEELSNKTYAAVAQILRLYATSYVGRFNNTLELNNTLLRVMAQMVGEMIACYPEDEREDVSMWVIDEMSDAEAVMAASLDARRAEAKEPEAKADDKYDLARMKPQGRC